MPGGNTGIAGSDAGPLGGVPFCEINVQNAGRILRPHHLVW